MKPRWILVAVLLLAIALVFYSTTQKDPVNLTTNPGEPGPDEEPFKAVDADPGNLVEGKVVSGATRKPVSGALVFLNGSGDALEIRTDADGLFSFAVIPPGRYRLEAYKDGMFSHPDRDRIPTFDMGVEDRIGPLVLFLEPVPVLELLIRSARTGDPVPGASIVARSGHEYNLTSGLDGRASLRLPMGIWEIEVIAPRFRIARHGFRHPFSGTFIVDLEPGGSLSGRVLGLGDKPLAAAPVYTSAWPLTPQVLSDENGAYYIDHVPLATAYHIASEVSGYKFFRAEGPILTGAEPDQVVDLHLEPNPNLKMGRLSGRVLGESGQPIEGAHFAFATPDYPIFTETWSQSDGSFVFEGLDLRSWAKHVLIEAPGFAARLIRVSLESGEEPIEVVLSPGHFLSGFIRDETGNPVSGAVISVNAAVGAYRLFSGDRILSGPNGGFSLNSLSDQVYLIVNALGFSPLKQRIVNVDRSDLVIVMREPGVIAGQVVESDGDKPVTRFMVKPEFGTGIPIQGAEQWDRTGIAFHDRDGLFRIDGLETGQSLSVTVLSDGFHPQTIDLPVVPNADAAPVLIRLPRLGQIVAGAVSAKDGVLLEGVHVTLLLFKDENARSVFSWKGMDQGLPSEYITRRETLETDHGGGFVFKDVNLDLPLDLILTGDEIARTRYRDLEKESPERLARLSLIAERGAVIQGIVSRTKYPEAKHLTLRRLDGTPLELAHDLKNEPYAFRGLPPGSYQLVLFKGIGSGEPGEKTVTRTGIKVEPGETVAVDFDEQSLHAVSGQVLIDGAPLIGGAVFLVGASDLLSNPKTQTDEKGMFHFEEISEGAYELVAYPGNPDVLNYLAIMRRYPNREMIRVKDDDFFDRFYFSGAGRILGKIEPAPTEKWLLFISSLMPDPDSGTLLLSGEPDVDGFFTFEAVPPGSYRLWFRPRFKANTGIRVLSPKITVPPGSEDIDLGIVRQPVENASLRIYPDGALSLAKPRVKIRVAPEGQDSANPLYTIYEGSITFGPEGALLQGLPSGRLALSTSILEGGYRTVPDQTSVFLSQQREASIYLALIPVTYLAFLNKTPGHDVTSAVITGNGMRITLEPAALGFLPETPLSDQAHGFFNGRRGIAWHIPEGEWRLEVVSTDKHWTTNLFLRQGQPSVVSVFFDR